MTGGQETTTNLTAIAEAEAGASWICCGTTVCLVPNASRQLTGLQITIDVPPSHRWTAASGVPLIVHPAILWHDTEVAGTRRSGRASTTRRRPHSTTWRPNTGEPRGRPPGGRKWGRHSTGRLAR
jgi:hypothetical protein